MFVFMFMFGCITLLLHIQLFGIGWMDGWID